MRKINASLSLAFIGCSFFLIIAANMHAQKETIVIFKTTIGDIKMKLYNETPKHRDNFIKLVKDKTYDSCLFHRVIQEFMIQGGDPESKKAAPGVMLGNGNVGYTIPAEINPSLFHKRGALAAARMGDDVNPNKESSGCQFYIVQGRTFANEDIDAIEARSNTPLKQKIFSDLINKPENKQLKDKFVVLQQAGKSDSLQLLSKQIEPMVEKEFANVPHLKYSEEQRKAYATIGGSPHLDGGYTVYGEVIEGMDVVDKIAAIPVDQYSRPTTDIRIVKAEILK